MSDTPQTDARITTFTSISKLKKHFTNRTGTVSAEFARELERQCDAWREVAAHLHAALEAAKPGPFPGTFDSAIRCSALEAYARLKNSVSQPSSLNSQLPHES